MGIQSFLKAQKGDPDWAYTPEEYFDKEFTVIDANMIELGQDRTDKIVLRHSPEEKKMLAKNLRFDVREGATLDVTIINEAGKNLQQVFIYDIRVREGGTINLGLFIKGGKLNKHIMQVVLDDGANFNAYGYAMNNVGGDCEIISKVEHQGVYTISNQFFGTEAGKDSQTVFQGMINVQQNAYHATVGVENINLNLGGGYCHGVPEIYNGNDTSKISSGTTTEPLDQDRTYYLQTRGLSQANSESVIINTHRRMALNIVQDQDVRTEIEQMFLDT